MDMQKALAVDAQIKAAFEAETYTDLDGIVWEGVEGETIDGDRWVHEDGSFGRLDSSQMMKKMINELMWPEDHAAAKESALAKMVKRLDSRDKRTSRGYVTKRDELIDILSEVSKRVSVVIAEEELPYSVQHKEISVKISLSLTLERDLL